MIGSLYPVTLVVIVFAIVAGCADDPYSDRHRSGYSFENVDMGSPRSGQEYRFDERPPASNMDPYSRSQPGRY